VSAGELDGHILLGDLPVRAMRLGAGPPSLVASRQAIDNEWVGGFVNVPRDDCMLAYARGAPSIDDVDIAVYSEEGTSLAVDEGRDVHPTVLVCSPHPDRVYVAAHVVEGEGLVAVGAQLVAKDRAVIMARTFGARGTFGEEPRPADAWPGLDDAVRTHRAELGGQWDEFKRIALPVDARVPTFVSMTMVADECVDAIVVPDDDVALLDVEAMDGEGRVVARAAEGSGARILTICSPVGMDGTVSVRPHVGRGLAAVVLARANGDVVKDLSARPQVAWIVTPRALEAARTARNALLAKRGYAAPVANATGTLALGRRIAVPLEWKSSAAPCARVDVVAGAPLALVFGRIWSEAGALLASGEASSSLALFACARGPARLELETRGRPGPFAVALRPERWTDPVFLAHPLAASRMLARAAVGPDMLLDGKDVSVRAIDLGSAQALSFAESVPAGTCLRVIVGAEGDGSGVEMRAFDASSEEIDRAEAAHAASVRACAPRDQARAVHLEVRASAGRMSAVLGERLIDSPAR
jgi:hypothetical protein